MNTGIDVTVAAVVESSGRFLVVEERVAGELVFNQPAGHLEHGESLVEAVIRETLEESAWAFEPAAVTGIYLWSVPDTDRTFLRVAFSGDCRGHDPDRALDDGIVRATWLTREQLAARSARLRSPMVLRCIDDYTAGIRYPLDVLTQLDSLPEAQQRIASR